MVNNVDKFGNTPLHGAVWHGHVEAAKFLINKDANKNVKNKIGDTPVKLAKQTENEDMIKLFE